MGKFHWLHGVTFEREKDGSVHVEIPDPTREGNIIHYLIDADSWASIAASVSFRGDTAEAFALAQRFHSEVRREVVPDPHFTPHIG